MSSKLSLIFGFCCLLNVCISNKIDLVPAAFYKAEIVPDLLSKAPMEYIEVQFPSGKNVHLGNKLTPYQVKDKPFVSWSADNDGLYTLLMVDPDSADGETFHWLVINIPGCDLSKGQTVIEFLSSATGRNTGYHRYTWLVFKQAKRIETTEYIPRLTIEGRLSVVRQLIAEWRLRTVAGNYYLAKWDTYAQSLRDLLGLP